MLTLDLVLVSNSALILFNVDIKGVVETFKGSKYGEGLALNPIIHLFNSPTNSDKSSIVVSPFSKGSVASLPPKSILGEFTTKTF